MARVQIAWVSLSKTTEGSSTISVTARDNVSHWVNIIHLLAYNYIPSLFAFKEFLNKLVAITAAVSSNRASILFLSDNPRNSEK